MPFVMMALAPGFAGQGDTQLAVDDARLMLPYLAFAGPVTVMMALLNAQGRFALTAFSPLLFNIALISVMIALLLCRQDAVMPRRSLRRPSASPDFATLVLVLRRAAASQRPFVSRSTRKYAAFWAKAVPGMIASSAPQL